MSDWLAMGVWMAAPVLGFVGLLAVRVWEQSPRQSLGQWVFWCCLAAVAILTLTNMSWLSGGLTFSLMSVGAAVDLDGTPGANVNY